MSPVNSTDRGSRDRWPLVRLLGAVLAGAAAVLGLVFALEPYRQREPARPPGDLETLHVRYQGAFRYEVVATVWEAAESVVVSRAVLARVTEARRPRAGALGPDWRYRGTLGLQRTLYVYVRKRRVAAKDDTAEEPTFRPVAIPAIHRGRVRFVPGPQSTMEFTGPANLVNETNPAGKRHTAGGASTIAVDVAGSLDDRERSSVEIFARSEDGESLWSRAFDSVLALVGLAITTAVTAAVTVWVQRRSRRRRRSGRRS
jgi:hypothetical protein